MVKVTLRMMITINQNMHPANAAQSNRLSFAQTTSRPTGVGSAL